MAITQKDIVRQIPWISYSFQKPVINTLYWLVRDSYSEKSKLCIALDCFYELSESCDEDLEEFAYFNCETLEVKKVTRLYEGNEYLPTKVWFVDGNGETVLIVDCS